MPYYPCVSESISHSVVSDSVTSRTVARQASLSMEFPRQEYWSGLSFPSLGNIPGPEIEPKSPTLRADSLPSEPPRKPESFSSVTQLCPTLCDPMDRRVPGFPVHYQHPEFAQTHVHRVRDAIQPSHPLLSPSPPAFSLSQHQGLFH